MFIEIRQSITLLFINIHFQQTFIKITYCHHRLFVVVMVYDTFSAQNIILTALFQTYKLEITLTMIVSLTLDIVPNLLFYHFKLFLLLICITLIYN